MTLRISGSNNVVYRNETSDVHRVTIVVSGKAKLEVLPNAGTAIHRAATGDRGGAVSLEVPAQHRIEIDVVELRQEIDVEFLAAT